MLKSVIFVVIRIEVIWVLVLVAFMLSFISRSKRRRHKNMKCEIVKVKGRGVCILISNINPSCLLSAIQSHTEPYSTSIFKDVISISELIRTGQKIAAIKEVRTQTGWGLKEAKEYIDKYLPMGLTEIRGFDYTNAAESFINANMPTVEYLKEEDMEIL